VLRSEASGRFYIGSSQDIGRRLEYHNTGKVKATRYLRPLALAYQEAYVTGKEARQREYYLKRQKSRRVLEALISARVVSSVG
jgi:predicted GIY-YIG superfamily endonuclease